MKLVPLYSKTSELGYMYRYVDSYAGTGYRCERYPILKITPCGYWIDTQILTGGSGSKRWVARCGKNNFAKVTKEAALKNYFHRKHRHILILEEKLRSLKNVVSLVGAELEAALDAAGDTNGNQ